MDEFYLVDSVDWCRHLLCVNYLFLDEDKPIAFFCLSNDAIRREMVPSKSAFRRVATNIHKTKSHVSYPAVKIGRLGVACEFQGQGHGRLILDFLKAWLTEANNTGCRFLLADAYNPKAVAFYQRNGFKFLTHTDEHENTRIMYFDLTRFVRVL